MAKWIIETEEERQRRAIERWGEEEWNRRLKIVKEKAELLEKADNWQMAMFYAPQFEALAMEITQEQFDKLENMTPGSWKRVIQRVIGS